MIDLCNLMQRGAHIKMILIQRVLSCMLYNGCKSLTIGEGEPISKECLVRGNIRKCGDSLTTRKNRGKSLYRKTKNTTWAKAKKKKKTIYVCEQMYRNVCVLNIKSEVRSEF